MISLIKNELCKIFHRKGIYIVVFITILFSLLVNYIYSEYDTDNLYSENYSYTNYKYDSDSDYLLYNKTNTDISDYINSFDIATWQRYVLTKDNDLYSKFWEVFLSINNYELAYSDDEIAYAQALEELSSLKEKLNGISSDEYTEQKRKETLEKLELAKETNEAHDIAYYQSILDALDLRIECNVSYAFDERNENLEAYEDADYSILYYTLNSDEYESSSQEMIDYYKSDLAIAESKVRNNISDVDMSSINSILSNFYDEYYIMILVMIVLVSASIVSQEFSKGTIKLLLVKPHSRIKILMSKYITSLLMMFFAIAITLIIQIVIGGLFLSYDSLNIPTVVYDYATETAKVMSIFKYWGWLTIATLPQLILITTLAFSLSTIFVSTSLATTLTIIGAFGSSVISLLAETFTVDYLKYFVTMNWDFTYYLFGGSSPYDGITLPFSIVVCCVYLLVMLIISFFIFKKRNIKNV